MVKEISVQTQFYETFYNQNNSTKIVFIKNSFIVVKLVDKNFSCILSSTCGISHRGVATLGSSRHVPTHNFHKILRKICIKLNVFIFLVFNVFSKIRNKIVIHLDLFPYSAIINAIQTAVTVIDQFIALKNRKMNFIWSKPKLNCVQL